MNFNNSLPSKTLRILPIDYVPQQFTVVVAKGNIAAQAEGNTYLRQLVRQNTKSYQSSERKSDKTEIVKMILHEIKASNTDGIGFVKFHANRWYECTDIGARDIISARFRDCLHSHYKSSTKHKVAKRRLYKAIQRSMVSSTASNLFDDDESSSDDSSFQASPEDQETSSSQSAVAATSAVATAVSSALALTEVDLEPIPLYETASSSAAATIVAHAAFDAILSLQEQEKDDHEAPVSEVPALEAIDIAVPERCNRSTVVNNNNTAVLSNRVRSILEDDSTLLLASIFDTKNEFPKTTSSEFDFDTFISLESIVARSA